MISSRHLTPLAGSIYQGLLRHPYFILGRHVYTCVTTAGKNVNLKGALPNLSITVFLVESRSITSPRPAASEYVIIERHHALRPAIWQADATAGRLFQEHTVSNRCMLQRREGEFVSLLCTGMAHASDRVDLLINSVASTPKTTAGPNAFQSATQRQSVGNLPTRRA